MAHVSERELERSFEMAGASRAEEDRFLAMLLDAVVYVHVPASDDSGRVRLIQFRHPEGFDAIPAFTSEGRASFAASKAVKILRLPCRALLQSTRRATFMVNPNDGGPVLYPEEIDTLLSGQALASVEKVSLEDATWDVRPAVNPPARAMDALQSALKSAPFIRQVYALDIRDVSQSGPPNLLIYAAVETQHMERAGRLITSVIQGLSMELDRTVDVSVYDVAGPRPGFIGEVGAKPAF